MPQICNGWAGSIVIMSTCNMRSGKARRIESPYILANGTRFVQPGKIEIDANERVVTGSTKAAFSFAPPSILSLMIYLRFGFLLIASSLI